MLLAWELLVSSFHLLFTPSPYFYFLNLRSLPTGRQVKFGRKVPRKPRLVGGVKGHNINDYYITGKPRRACPVRTGWPGSFKSEIRAGHLLRIPPEITSLLSPQKLLYRCCCFLIMNSLIYQ
jgi:hypothetical protein